MSAYESVLSESSTSTLVGTTRELPGTWRLQYRWDSLAFGITHSLLTCGYPPHHPTAFLKPGFDQSTSISGVVLSIKRSRRIKKVFTFLSTEEIAAIRISLLSTNYSEIKSLYSERRNNKTRKAV